LDDIKIPPPANIGAVCLQTNSNTLFQALRNHDNASEDLCAATLPQISPLGEKRVGYRIERWEKPVEADMPILTDDYAPVEVYVAGIEGRETA